MDWISLKTQLHWKKDFKFFKQEAVWMTSILSNNMLIWETLRRLPLDRAVHGDRKVRSTRTISCKHLSPWCSMALLPSVSRKEPSTLWGEAARVGDSVHKLRQRPTKSKHWRGPKPIKARIWGTASTNCSRGPLVSRPSNTRCRASTGSMNSAKLISNHRSMPLSGKLREAAVQSKTPSRGALASGESSASPTPQRRTWCRRHTRTTSQRCLLQSEWWARRRATTPALCLKFAPKETSLS